MPLAVFESEGIEGVQVERLARDLNVAKSGFCDDLNRLRRRVGCLDVPGTLIGQALGSTDIPIPDPQWLPELLLRPTDNSFQLTDHIIRQRLLLWGLQYLFNLLFGLTVEVGSAELGPDFKRVSVT